MNEAACGEGLSCQRVAPAWLGMVRGRVDEEVVEPDFSRSAMKFSIA
jgi:HSP90 family molecular chaperone